MIATPHFCEHDIYVGSESINWPHIFLCSFHMTHFKNFWIYITVEVLPLNFGQMIDSGCHIEENRSYFL